MKQLKSSIGLLLVLMSVSACSPPNKSKLATVSYQPSLKLVEKNVEIEFVKFEKKKDIENKIGIFVFAEMSNKGKQNIYPESIWMTQVALAKSRAKDESSLYQAVLTKKELDGSVYKKAVDRMSEPIEPGEKAKVGYFYGLGSNEDEIELILYDENHNKIEVYSLEYYIE